MVTWAPHMRRGMVDHMYACNKDVPVCTVRIYIFIYTYIHLLGSIYVTCIVFYAVVEKRFGRGFLMVCAQTTICIAMHFVVMSCNVM